jgi:hypothetical protein
MNTGIQAYDHADNYRDIPIPMKIFNAEFPGLTKNKIDT